jgi:hypothetical protein
MKKTIKNYSIALSLIFSVLSGLNSCSKKNEDSSGSVVISEATNVTYKSASIAVEITDPGESEVTDAGVCWSTSESPTIDDKVSHNYMGSTSFTCTLTGLSANTKYYARGYVTNITGTKYGNQVSFTTSVKPVSSFSASIDGVAFTPTLVQALSTSALIMISGNSGTKTIVLYLPTLPTVGAHSVSQYGSYTAQYSPTSTTLFPATSGTITITEYNSSTGKIKGTFNFVGSDSSTTKNITDGQFEVYK